MRYLLLIPLIPASIAIEAWLLMLTVGVIHGEWLSGMPTIGYWSSVLVVLMLTAVGASAGAVKGIGAVLFGDES